MSIRSIIIGLIGALFIAGFGYINNYVIGLDSFELGYLLPISVVGLLILFLITINPLLFKIRKTWALRAPETAVIILMMLVALSIPGRGLMEQLTSCVGMPAHWNKMNPGWQEHKLLDYVPDAMLIGTEPEEMRDVEDFIAGKGQEGTPIGLKDVPWGTWKGPLLTWISLALLSGIAVTCLALIVHSQWSSRERIRYPIAEFISTLMKRDPHQVVGAIFQRKNFWVGLAIVFVIHLINGLNVWLEGPDITIPLRFDFSAVAEKWPQFFFYGQSGYLTHPRLYPIVIAFAFFLATDISFTLGMTQFILLAVWIPLTIAGIPMHTSYMSGGPMGWHRAGAYIAFALMLLYTGRRYYWCVLKQAVTFRQQENVEPYAGWAGRLFIVSMIAMITIVTMMGLDWTIAILTFILMMVLFLVVSRISAETGLFFIHARWVPMGMLLGLLGGHAFGPKAMLMVGLISAILCLDPSVGLMPFFVNALKMNKDLGIKPSKSAWLCLGAYLPALILATVVVLWANYNYGVPKAYGWNYQRVPTMAFRPVAREIMPMVLSETVEESENLGPIERLTHMKPDKTFLWAAGTGFFLVLIVSLMRLRFSWWPIHPVLFLVISTHPLARFNHSFMIGWALKVAITKWGGTKTYERCKPFMIGLIAGDLLGALVFMIAGGIYYAITGTKPPAYHAFKH